VYKTFSLNREIILSQRDCLAFIKTIPSESIDLTITSPPYCMGKKYDHSRDYADFESLHKKLIPEVFRVTKKGGHICWQTGYHVKNGIVMPLDLLVHKIAMEIDGLFLRNRIIWRFGHGLHCRNRFSGRHEVVMWYSKGNEYSFNLDAVRIAQKYPGKTHYKGSKKGKPSGHPRGKNPSNVWDIPCVKANHIEKTEHPCQFPIALVQRVILALTKENDLVLDPFSGAGTSGCAAIITKRRFVGCEVDSTYYDLAAQRLRKAVRGDLAFRPHDKAICEPCPTQKVARKPT